MQKKLFKGIGRGHKNYDWLDTYHSFSFSDYYDPNKMNFGALRVLNDDRIAPGKGFGFHGHKNMEIITIPIYGRMRHQDNQGNSELLRTNEVQVMSAGTGIQHSEFNASATEEASLFQLWIYPEEQDVKPRYEQKYFDQRDRDQRFQILAHPNGKGDGLGIHQQAWISLGNFAQGANAEYKMNERKNGLFVFVIEGKLNVLDEHLMKRDGIGLSEGNEVINFGITAYTQLLMVEVPMVK